MSNKILVVNNTVHMADVYKALGCGVFVVVQGWPERGQVAAGAERFQFSVFGSEVSCFSLH